MKIMVFLQGTATMPKSAINMTREKRIRQSLRRDPEVLDYGAYVPVGKVVDKLKKWAEQGVEICYLSSHKDLPNIENDKLVLKKYGFPPGEIYFRRNDEEYKDVAEKVMPDILVEDDCESVGGETEMTYPHINSNLRDKIKSIVIKEFGGIDHLTDDIGKL